MGGNRGVIDSISIGSVLTCVTLQKSCASWQDSNDQTRGESYLEAISVWCGPAASGTAGNRPSRKNRKRDQECVVSTASGAIRLDTVQGKSP